MTVPANVVALRPVGDLEPTRLSGMPQRTAALLGKAPMITFDAEESCCSVQLRPTAGSLFVGLASDKAAFTDRVRLAGGNFEAAFVVHADARTPTVCGKARVRVLGRGADDDGLDPDVAAVVRELVQSAPFGADGQVIIGVEPLGVQIDERDSGVHGAVPRT
jgi:hypothetical protein